MIKWSGVPVQAVLLVIYIDHETPYVYRAASDREEANTRRCNSASIISVHALNIVTADALA